MWLESQITWRNPKWPCLLDFGHSGSFKQSLLYFVFFEIYICDILLCSETTWAVDIAQLTHREVRGRGKNPVLLHTVKAEFILRARVYARMRGYTLNRPYSQRTVLRAYTRVCARTYAEEFNLVELSRPALISHPMKCVCEGHAQPTDIDAMHAYTRICSYL